jgi:FdhD protein
MGSLRTLQLGVASRLRRRALPEGLGEPERDFVAVEAPLEIQIDGEPIAVTMRTPGQDSLLALGFLLAEGVIASADDVVSLVPCGQERSIDARLREGLEWDEGRKLESRRWTVVSSACGTCGRRSVQGLVDRVDGVDGVDGVTTARVSPSLIARCLDDLATDQPAFLQTGGLHAAAAFTSTGRRLACHEDVGRHNAVDKVVGELLRERLVGQAAVLAVSGRASFEIVQKAAVARIPVVASVSAASSMAIDLAQEAGITLAAFVRGGRFNVYSCVERLEGGGGRSGRSPAP